jgi:hypothetical protein
MSEQRASRRQRVLKSGMIAFGEAGIDCLVRNISATGAALEVESQIGIPPEFKLVISAEHFDEFCRVLWRKAKRIGVVFQPEAAADGAPPPAATTAEPAPGPTAAPPANQPDNPSTPPPPACIRSIDTLPEHPGPPLAPDFPC